VATYLVLDGKAREVFQGLLARHGNEEGQVAMMTWAEMESAKIAREVSQKCRDEGLQEGRQEGMREMLLRLLSRRFETLPAGVAKRISAIDSAEELAGLAERVLSANSLEELGLA
jgi:flagellar biosynthesis/type III secretory pathway protein FliH